MLLQGLLSTSSKHGECTYSPEVAFCLQLLIKKKKSNMTDLELSASQKYSVLSRAFTQQF